MTHILYNLPFVRTEH